MKRVLAAFALASIGLALDVLATPSAAAAPIEGMVMLGGAPGAGAVVYLEGSKEAPAPAQPTRVVMDQRNLAFVPRVLAVVRGTVVEFHNSDDVPHNIFSPSTGADALDLGTYGRGATRTVTMREPGDLRVLCNIHMEMEARILVLRDPYFATVGADGRYRIADVPAGSYRLKIWRDGWQPYERTVEVAETSPEAAAAPVVVDVRIER
jgi:plastocyanin